MVDEYTFLWKSANFRQKSRSSQSELNAEVAVESADFKVSLLDSVAHTCIISTISIYQHKFSNRMFLGFLPISRDGVSAGVRK